MQLYPGQPELHRKQVDFILFLAVLDFNIFVYICTSGFGMDLVFSANNTICALMVFSAMLVQLRMS